jgi:hypothetical protein
VRAAVENGQISEHRLQSFLDLRAELERVAQRREERARKDSKARWKARSKEIRRFYKDRGHT